MEHKIINRIILLACLAVSLMGLEVSFAGELSNECSTQVDGGLQWSYCISRVEGSKNPDLVYYFHGIDGSEKDWVEHSIPVREKWAKDGQDAPTVVSISFGTVWLLAPHSGSELTGMLMDFVMKAAIPQIESKLGGVHGRRMLVGRSMGGFNATELYLWYPEVFERVALLCPALSQISPFASDEEFEELIARTGALPTRVNRARDLGRFLFQNEANWRTVSPLLIAPLKVNSRYPKLFVSTGRQDDYGFFDGAEIFADLVHSQGVSEVEWYPVEGKHCEFDAQALAKFLIK